MMREKNAEILESDTVIRRMLAKHRNLCNDASQLRDAVPSTEWILNPTHSSAHIGKEQEVQLYKHNCSYSSGINHNFCDAEKNTNV